MVALSLKVASHMTVLYMRGATKLGLPLTMNCPVLFFLKITTWAAFMLKGGPGTSVPCSYRLPLCFIIQLMSYLTAAMLHEAAKDMSADGGDAAAGVAWFPAVALARLVTTVLSVAACFAILHMMVCHIPCLVFECVFVMFWAEWL